MTRIGLISWCALLAVWPAMILLPNAVDRRTPSLAWDHSVNRATNHQLPAPSGVCSNDGNNDDDGSDVSESSNQFRRLPCANQSTFLPPSSAPAIAPAP